MKTPSMLTKIIAILSIGCLLSSCGFHLRNAQSVPPALRHIYLSSAKPYSAFNIELNQLLRSLHIRLAHSAKQARYTLQVSKVQFSHDNPAITSNSNIINYTYTMTVHASIINQQGKIVVPSATFSQSQSMILNTSQTYTPSAGHLTRQQLQRNIINNMYYWLTNSDTRKALEHHHAT